MMYNSQQYGVGGAGAGGAGSQQNPYAAMGVNPAMMQGNGGMAHMAINNGVGTYVAQDSSDLLYYLMASMA